MEGPISNEQTLTVSIDEDVVRRARRLARQWDTSISQLVEESLRGLTEKRGESTPLVAELRDSLPEDASRAEHRRHLEQKHGG